jgi:hypothetical protein
MTNTLMYEDLRGLLLGEKLGEGVYRKVSVFRPDKRLVIKVAEEDPHPNVIEYRIWEELMDTKVAKWFAPCVAISTCGLFLLQKRVEMHPKSEYPKMVPHFFTDCKYSNFGWLDGKFVCCDYGGFVITNGFTNKMKKADWWE